MLKINWIQKIKEDLDIVSKLHQEQYYINLKDKIKIDQKIKEPNLKSALVIKDLFNNEFNDEISIGDSSKINTKVKKEIDQGLFKIDSKIDLHNHRLNNAFESFQNFIFNSLQNHNRLVLVVTGKSINTSEQDNTINKSIIKWCNNPKISGYIMYINYAAAKDGGEGAFYIMLRKIKIMQKIED